MVVTDPIADMLTMIRNASFTKKEKVDVKASKIKENLLKMLKREGYITNYKSIKDNKQGILRVYIKHDTQRGLPAITGLQRISKPGLRIYVTREKIPYVLSGLGTAILSTSKGLLTDKEARKMKTGGEILCYVW